MTVSAPEEDAHFALILGKPGGGKGTISGKILKVWALSESVANTSPKVANSSSFDFVVCGM
jgi:hypothetical protein